MLPNFLSCASCMNAATVFGCKFIGMHPVLHEAKIVKSEQAAVFGQLSGRRRMGKHLRKRVQDFRVQVKHFEFLRTIATKTPR